MGRYIKKEDILIRLNNINDFINEYSIDIDSIDGICSKATFTHKKCGHTFNMMIKSFIGNKSNPGHRCPYCAAKNRIKNNTKTGKTKLKIINTGKRSKSLDEYITKINNVPNYKFINLDEEYKGSLTKVNILHTSCNKIFSKRISDFLYNNQHCPYCVENTRLKSYDEAKEKFLEHGFILLDDYFNGTHSKSHLECCDCHEKVERSYNTIVNLNGKCSCHKDEYKGEKLIKKFLNENNIEFIPGKTFDDLKYKSNLRCDFFIKNLNTIIEYDGIQHFIKREYFSTPLDEIRNRDIAKNNYANNLKINIIRISYKEVSYNEIKKILNYFLLNKLVDGKPYDGKLSRTVWVGGKSDYNEYIEYNSK